MRQFIIICLGLLIICLQVLIGVKAFFPDAFIEEEDSSLEELMAQKKQILDKLSPEDLFFLSNNPIITVGVDPNFYPVEMFDERGRYSGLAADYLKLISHMSGLEFRPAPQSDWASTEENTKKGAIHILPAVSKTGRRSEYLLFTAPYISLPGIIMARRDSEAPISTLQDLAGKKVAVTKDYAWHDFLREFHPEITLLPAMDSLEAMRLVTNGEAEAVVDYEFNLMEKAQSSGIMQLEKKAEIHANYGHSLGVRKDQPELFEIISIALGQISPEERQKLANKWFKRQVPETGSKRLQWIFFFLLESVLLCLGLQSLMRHKIKIAQKEILTKCAALNIKSI